MADTLRATQKGLELVDRARKRKGWNRTAARWLDEADTSKTTMNRFWKQIPIRREAFQNICKVVGVDWQEVVDSSIEPQVMTELADSPDSEEREDGCELELPSEPFREREYEYSAYDEAWVGRQEAIAQLQEKLWGSVRVLALTGITGIGKTALAERLCQDLQRTMQDAGCKPFIAWVKINFDNQEWTDFARVATQTLVQWGVVLSEEEQQNPERLVGRWVAHLREHRYLVLIDSLEMVLRGDEETGWSNFRDEHWKLFFHRLLAVESLESRVLLTSQELPADLETCSSRYHPFWHCEPLGGLTSEERSLLFDRLGLDMEDTGSREYLERIGNVYEGHPLALRVVAGEILNPPYDGDVATYWQQYGHEIEEVEQAAQRPELESDADNLRLDRYTCALRRKVRQRVEQTFERLARDVPRAYQLLCLGSVYRRSAPQQFWLNTLARLGVEQSQRESALHALRDRYLVEEEIACDRQIYLRQHNLIRSVALEHLRCWQHG